MYLEHFSLHEYPFSITPDTSYFYDYDSHREALNVLRVALESGEGFLKITGDVGLGKTLLCRKLLAGLRDEYVTAYIPDPLLTVAGLRRSLALELGLDVSDRVTAAQLLARIQIRLIELAKKGKRVVLVIDEAQQLPEATLEGLRLLTNLETEKFKLLQVVLFGQPELDRRLQQPSIRQLKQRITFSYTLKPFDRKTVHRYVEHRLRVAGHRGAPLFDRAALKIIGRASRGVPRFVNILSHKALFASFGTGSHFVNARQARRAIRDTEGVRRGLRFFPALRAVTGGAMTAALAAVALYITGTSE